MRSLVSRDFTGVIRNNNTGNIRYSVFNNWVGQTGQDERGFVVFDTIQNGIRAHIKLLRNYINSGDNTIAKIINRWSPPNGTGNTQASTNNYISYVAQYAGIPMNEPVLFEMKPVIEKIAQAMTIFEHGDSVSGDVHAMTGLYSSAYDIVAGVSANPNFAGVEIPVKDFESVDPKAVAVAITLAIIISLIIYS